MKTPGRPVIIKRIKRVTGGGHHGGAWKVAYADFVTAMMAFFLLMWLINATSEEQRRGLADYFTPTVPMPTTHSGGDGPFGGSSMFSPSVLADDPAHLPPGRAGEEETLSPASDGDADRSFGDIEGALASSGDAHQANPLLQHIRTRLTDEGLIIEVFDAAGSPLFVGETTNPTPILGQLVAMIGRVIAPTLNPIAISGHTAGDIVDADPFDVSAGRAHSVRRQLITAGVAEQRFARVTGKADRDPYRDDAGDSRNRRVEITLLRRFGHINQQH